MSQHKNTCRDLSENQCVSLILRPVCIIIIVTILSGLGACHLTQGSVLLPVQVYITAGQSYALESKLRRLEQSAKNQFGGTTDSELSELEDVVALTAARVQSAESEVGG